METILFTKESLSKFIFSERYHNLVNVPISKHRAVSQINNPRAETEDILLIAQFDGNKTVGYIGILPDYIFIEESKEKIGWLTCFWVDENYRPQNVAADLFLMAIEAYNKNILITNIVPSLEPVYRKTKLFNPIQYQTGYRGYLRFNLSEILASKNKLFRRLHPFIKISDFLLNSIADLRFIFKRRYQAMGNYDYLISPDEISDDFIEKFGTLTWTRRMKAELNWIVKYPWLIEGIENDIQNRRYYFSYISRQFLTQTIKFSDHTDRTIGLMIMNVRNKHLTIPYLFCDKEHLNVITKFIIYTMVSSKLNMVTVFHKELSLYFNQIRTPFIFAKKIKKPFFISKNFAAVTSLNFQDGDGDCAFY